MHGPAEYSGHMVLMAGRGGFKPPLSYDTANVKGALKSDLHQHCNQCSLGCIACYRSTDEGNTLYNLP